MLLCRCSLFIIGRYSYYRVPCTAHEHLQQRLMFTAEMRLIMNIVTAPRRHEKLQLIIATPVL
jgi:hypothetical protein